MPAVRFVTFDTSHLSTMFFILMLWILFSWLGCRQKSIKTDKTIRWCLAAFLISYDVARALFLIIQFTDTRIFLALPLHLCDLARFAVIITLIWKNQKIWEIAWYWGIGGSLAAIITPDLLFGFPHLFYIAFFFHHAGVVIGSLYMAFSCRFPLQFSSTWRVWIWTHIYALFVFIVNLQMGTNFLYIMRKPDRPTMLDYMGPWPYYLLSMEALLILSLLALYWFFKLVPQKYCRKPA